MVGKSLVADVVHTVKLLLPALIPSWRFFDIVAPSPRIEFTLLETKSSPALIWQEFRPRPVTFTVGGMLKRMFWNPLWNESLFLVSCAERLVAHPTLHSQTEIMTRIARDIERTNLNTSHTPYLQFRLVFLTRQEEAIIKEVAFISPIEKCAC